MAKSEEEKYELWLAGQLTREELGENSYLQADVAKLKALRDEGWDCYSCGCRADLGKRCESCGTSQHDWE